MKKKYPIEVRQLIEGSKEYGHPNYGKYTSLGTIQRMPRAEQIGNFCPLFVTYKGKDRLLQSMAGDLSDPFRREESYANTFYIELGVDKGQAA